MRRTVVMYHGTTAEALESVRHGGWRGSLVYLTPSHAEAWAFARGVHLGGRLVARVQAAVDATRKGRVRK